MLDYGRATFDDTVTEKSPAVRPKPGGAWRNRRGGDEVNAVPMGSRWMKAEGPSPTVGVSRPNESRVVARMYWYRQDEFRRPCTHDV